jgi:hypothetical protein
MSEAEFQTQVISIARMYGWRVQHSRAVQMANGKWLTPIQGDAGFPDLILVKPGARGGIIYAELKTDLGRVAPHQRDWLRAIDAAGGEACVWRPTDMATIAERLSALRSNVRVTQ